MDFSGIEVVEAVALPATKTLEKPRVSGREVEWPVPWNYLLSDLVEVELLEDWESVEAAVRMEHFMGANEEFSLLRLAVLAADPVQLAGQVGKADLVWQFLAARLGREWFGPFKR